MKTLFRFFSTLVEIRFSSVNNLISGRFCKVITFLDHVNSNNHTLIRKEPRFFVFQLLRFFWYICPYNRTENQKN